MLRLAARRAAVQAPLLAALLAVVVAGATLLGVCALLLTTSQDRALETSAARAAPRDVSVTAYATGVEAGAGTAVAAGARSVLERTLAPFRAPAAARAAGAMRELPDDGGTQRLAYLSAVDGLPDRARLVSGRWPRAAAGPLEAVVLEPTARALGLSAGSRLELGRELRSGERTAADVVVVGVFRPPPGAGWERDPMGTAGYDPAYNDGSFPQGARAYGPFVVGVPELYGSGALDRLEVTAQPDLSRPTASELAALARALPGTDRRLSATLGDRVRVSRVSSALPATLASARVQQGATRATVLVVALLCTVLAVAVLSLAGRLTASLRAAEAGLLAALGAGRRQLAAAAAVEGAALAVLGAALAVPASVLLHAGLLRLPPLAGAGLAGPVRATGPQVAAVAAGAVLLAAALVAPALRPDPAQRGPTRGRLQLLARSGADAVLLALAVAGWWQLRSQPAAGSGPDAIRVLAPAVCLLAGAAVATRLVAAPLRAADRAARGSRGLVLPLAAFEAARRPQAVAAALLLALAAAAATFGLAFGATWDRSQHDQADVRVGTDLAVRLTAPVAAGDGPALAAATGGTVSPATDRGVAVGQWLGGAGDPPRLIAVDAARAGAVLRGRLPEGRSWASVGARLAPRDAVGGVPAAGGLRVAGTGAAGVLATPRLVLQDATGLRTVCSGPSVPLDGRPRAVTGCVAGQRIVAVAWRLEPDPAAEPDFSPGAVPISLTVATGGAPAAGAWDATATGDPGIVVGQAAAVAPAGSGAVLRTTASLFTGSVYGRPEIVATAFPAPGAVPVAVSERLSSALGTAVGAQLTVTAGTAVVPVVVADVVPSVPGAPDAAALLADGDALSRAFVVAGDLEQPVDALWVGGPARPDAAAAAAALGLGDVVTRPAVTRELTAGPLRAGLPAALLLLVPAAVLFALAGTVLHVTSEVGARALEVARLRGLGVPRRGILGGLLAQHGGMLALLVLAGAAVGAVAAYAVGPLLIRSETGAATVPAPAVEWPWAAEGALLAVLLGGCLAAVALVVAVQVRRADAAHLRVGP